jgi:hypothetical protein
MLKRKRFGSRSKRYRRQLPTVLQWTLGRSWGWAYLWRSPTSRLMRDITLDHRHWQTRVKPIAFARRLSTRADFDAPTVGFPRFAELDAPDADQIEAWVEDNDARLAELSEMPVAAATQDFRGSTSQRAQEFTKWMSGRAWRRVPAQGDLRAWPAGGRGPGADTPVRG